MKASLLKKQWFKSLLSSIVSIFIGVVVGFVVMIIITLFSETNTVADSFKGIGIMLSGPFASKTTANMLMNLGNTIFYTTPLIMTGLSVALAYKTGLFNIGAPGQYIMGTVACLLVALFLQTDNRVSGVFVWILAVLAGAVAGALWGTIPGMLKAFFNINEVIVCIMTNWIAANIASWLFSATPAIWSTENTKAGFLIKVANNYTPKLGLDKIFQNSLADGGIIFAIIIAVIIFVILEKTTFGFQLKSCGSNKNASKYAGLNDKRNIILSMAIAGALAGIGACFYFLNPGIEYKYLSQYAALPAYGFNGIASAFLANCSPLGIILSSFFIRYINTGGEFLTKVNLNRYVADIVVAVIIYLAGFSRIILEGINKISDKIIDKKEDNK